MATLAPLNPDIEFANAHTFFLRGQPPLIVSARLLVARAKRGVTLFVNPPPCRYCSAHSTHYVCCRPSFFGTTTSCVRSIHTAPLYHGKSLIPLVIPFHPSLITLTSSLHQALAQTDTHKQKDAPPLLKSVGVTRTRDLVLPSATTLAPLATARASSLRNKKTLHFVPQFFYCSVPDNLFFRQAKNPIINRQVVQVYPTQYSEPNLFNRKTRLLRSPGF